MVKIYICIWSQTQITAVQCVGFECEGPKVKVKTRIHTSLA